MANVQLLFPNLADTTTLSGGSWDANFPLTNLQTKFISQHAQTTDALTTSTQMTVTFPESVMLQALAVVGHNVTPGHDATYRLICKDALGNDTYDSGDQVVWGSFYSTSALDFESPNWLLGEPTQEDVERRETWPLMHLLSERSSTKTATLYINDTGNVDGKLRFGRLFAATGHQFARNYAPGARLDMENETRIGVTPGGAEYFDVRDGFLVFRFNLEGLDDSESFGHALDIMRRAGLDREILVVADPDDTTNLLRRSFLGRLRRLSGVEQIAYGLSGVSFEIKEFQG